jgi:hypothetical protein
VKMSGCHRFASVTEPVDMGLSMSIGAFTDW